jgi:acetyltransferase-like isoleucine patch superfamily enzyme
MKVINVVKRELGELLQFVVVYFPNDYIGRWLRKIYWGRLLNIGLNFNIERAAIIGDRRKIEIGSNFILGEYAQFAIGESAGVWIGNYVGIARYVWIRTSNHKYESTEIPIMLQGHESKSIIFNGKEYSVVIEDDVWVAPNTVILTGTHIGKGSVISAGSVVSGIIPSYSVVMGNPGRVIANRLKLAKLKAENGGDSNG